MVENLQEANIDEGQLVIVHQLAIQRAVEAQRGIEKVLPGPLFGDVEAGHLTGGAPRNHASHGAMLGDL